MKLLRMPYRPKTLPLTGPSLVRAGMPEAWAFYLGERLAATG